MKIYVGADHGGYELKETLVRWLEAEGYEVADLGAHSLDPADDYPDYAFAVADSLSLEPEARGIVLCRNGVGVDIAVNRFSGVRCVLAFDLTQVETARNDDNVNCLSLPADYVDEDTAKKLIEIFLQTDFSGQERFLRRLEKLEGGVRHECACGGAGCGGHCDHHHH